MQKCCAKAVKQLQVGITGNGWTTTQKNKQQKKGAHILGMQDEFSFIGQLKSHHAKVNLVNKANC